MLRSVYDTLPSPTNLHVWRLVEDPVCKICVQGGSMTHILSGCAVALQQGSYQWKNDKVLIVLADILVGERKNKRPSN